MLRTKKDVDKHVQQICEKVPSEVERNLKGFTIAKLYFNVGDFETARKYLAKYISVRENSSAAFKLNGHILESQKEKQKALKSYKKAFELDNSQKEVVLKICELMCELPLDPEKARYWVEVGEKIHPNNSVVSQLRVKMAGADFENGGAAGSSDVSSPETNREETSVLWSTNGASRLDDLSHSTPRWMGGEQGTPTRRFAPRPSPERLASHIKRLEDSHEQLLNTVLDTQRAMLEEIRQGNRIWKDVKEEVAGLRQIMRERDQDLSSLRQSMRERDQDLAKSASAAASAAVAAAESAKAAAISSHQRVEEASSKAAANKESRDVKQLELELAELRAQQSAQNTILHNALVQMSGSGFHNAAAAAMIRAPMAGQLRPDLAAAMGLSQAGMIQMQQLASMQGFGDMFPMPPQPPVIAPHQQQPVQSNESIANLLLRQQQQQPQAPKPLTPKVGLTPVSTPVETPAHSGNATPIPQKPKPLVPPTNVVITSSEKIPSGSAIPTFTGSVTVPPQHRLGSTSTPVRATEAPAYSAVTPDKSGSSPFALGRQRQASISSQKSVDGSHAEEDEHDPCPDFKPIIPLPEEVEVVTGEENEEVMFEDRSKLFRFIDMQWKERGVGQLKVLKHKETGKIRVLMRRDQTHKIAANHFIVIDPDMKLKKMANNDKAVTWNANDFADEELRTEVFCAKFKTADQADNFKDVMEKAIDIIRGSKSSGGAAPPPSSKPVENLGSLAAFKPKAGSWECGGCFIRNPADKIQCPACQTAKPGHEEEVKAKEEAAKPKISFGAGGGFKFGTGGAPAAATTTTAASGFSFGSPATTAAAPAATTTTASGFSFGSKPTATTTTTGFSFGTPTATTAAAPTAASTTFGNFSFTSSPVVKPTEPDTTAAAATKEEAKPPSVFSSFSFTKPATTTAAAPATGGFSFTQQTPDIAGTSANTSVTINLGGGSKVTEVSGSTELSFDGKGLKLNTESDAEPVAKEIENFKNMKTLTLSGNTVGIDAAKVIGRALEKHPEFEYAHWKDMFTGRMKTEIPPALEHLCNGIMKAKAKLVELDLSDNAMGPVGLKGLVTFLKSPSCFSLQQLRLNNTGCGVTGGKQLAETLLECHKEGKKVGKPLALKVFILGRSRQENDGATALAGVFKLMGSLEEVVMPQNGIYHAGIAALTDAFANNPNLKILNLNDNTFTEKGAEYMAKLLPNLQKLTYLNLGDCLLRTAGAKLIASALKDGHHDLEELYLDSNEIRTEGGLAIIEAIANKSKLKKLVIDSNQFGSEGCAAILKKLGEIGKGHLISEISDDEEPESDEDDDEDAEDEEETEEDEKKESPPKPVSAIFGGTPSSSSASKNLFGGSSNASTPTTGIFGSTSSQSASPSIFGGGKPSGGFGSDSSKPASIFGSASESSSIFGGNSESKPSIFGGASSGGLFGKPVITSPDSTNAGKDLSESKKLSSFGALAANTGDGYSFGAKKEGFAFAGAGAAVFGQKGGAPKGEGDEEGGEDNHDPHFEPIIPLPELVQVTTGEEEEQAVFQHRAKLYRYSPETKEWKERGVGDMKILKHKTNNTFRVLLRREQIHKIACNHRITTDMELKPMMSSETAVCWFAMDYAEDEGKVEQFAVRFKHAETKDQFKAKFEECQAELRKAPSQPKVTVAKHAEGESEDSEEEDDEDDGNTMFIRKCELSEQNADGSTKRLGRVVLKVVYDDEYYGAKVVAIPEDNTSSEDDDEYEELCNHLIAMHTNLNEDDANTFTWSALDFATDSQQATYKTFTARFEKDEDGQDFRDTFYEGKDLAEQSEIIEQPGGHEVDPNDMYYGEGGDFNQEA